MRVSKTKVVLIIQSKAQGCAWEDESSYERTERKDANADLKEYRASSVADRVGYRLITRRVKVDDEKELPIKRGQS